MRPPSKKALALATFLKGMTMVDAAEAKDVHIGEERFSSGFVKYCEELTTAINQEFQPRILAAIEAGDDRGALEVARESLWKEGEERKERPECDRYFDARQREEQQEKL